MYYMIYQTKCKVYNTKNNKYITFCEKDYYVLVIELLSAELESELPVCKFKF